MSAAHLILDASANVNTNLQLMLDSLHQSAETRHAELVNKIDILQSQYMTLRVDHDNLKEKCNGMSQELIELKGDLHDVQQKFLANDVIIRGLPDEESNDEEITSMVTATFTALNVAAVNENIIQIRRLGKRAVEPANGNKRPILVKFADEKSKMKVIGAKRKTKLNGGMIVVNGKKLGSCSDEVYVEDHLTKEKSNLFAEARKLRKDKVVKFAWTSNGTILVRKDENEPAFRINTHDDIVDIRENPEPGLKRKPSPEKAPSRNTRQRKAAAAAAEAGKI